MSFTQVDDFEPEELVRHTKKVLYYAGAAYAEKAAVAIDAMSAVFREKMNMLNARTTMDDHVTEDIRRDIASTWTGMVATNAEWAARARTESARAKAVAEIADDTYGRPVVEYAFKIHLHLNQWEYERLLDEEFELPQAPMFNITKLIEEATYAFARMKRVRQIFELAEAVSNSARNSVLWTRRLAVEQEPGEQARYPLSPGRTERITRMIEEFKEKALAGLDIIHREQLMGEWPDEVINADAERRIRRQRNTDAFGKFIKRRTRKNSKKTKRRRQKFAKRFRGTKKRS